MRKTIFKLPPRILIIGVVVALVALGGGAYAYIQSLTTLPSFSGSYRTVQSTMPVTFSCVWGGGERPGVAKEIVDIRTDIAYLAGGENPMPDDVWEATSFNFPIIKNSDRNLVFDETCFYRSPGTEADCEGDTCFVFEELAGYTWMSLLILLGQDCYPDAVGCSTDGVNAGYVTFTTIDKCQRLVFNGPVIYELRDGTGNVYVMHATATGTPDLTPTLPDGWTLSERTLEEPLELLPFGGGDPCYYNTVRDNQGYHQVAYTGDTYP